MNTKIGVMVTYQKGFLSKEGFELLILPCLKTIYSKRKGQVGNY